MPEGKKDSWSPFQNTMELRSQLPWMGWDRKQAKLQPSGLRVKSSAECHVHTQCSEEPQPGSSPLAAVAPASFNRD